MKKMKKAYGWQYRSSSLCPAGIEPAFQAPEACALSIGLRTRSAGDGPAFFRVLCVRRLRLQGFV